MKLINTCTDYMLDYFGLNWQKFNKLLSFFNHFKHFKFKWRLFNICLFVYILPKFILHKLKFNLYVKPKWFVEGLKNKYIKRKEYGYNGYESYSEWDKERRIDFGADMYK